MAIESHVHYSTDNNLFLYHHKREVFHKNEEKENVNHAHLQYEIIYLVEGELSCIIEGKLYRLTKGDILLIRANDFHTINIVSNVYTRKVIQFFPAFIPLSEEQRNDLLRPYQVYNKNFDSVISSKIVSLYGLDKFFEKIETAQTELSSAIYIMNLLLEINNLLAFYKMQPNFTYTSSIITDIIDYIDNHLTSKITLEDLQEALHLSKFYISHLFKEVMGTTLAHYIMEKKIRYAEKLIFEGVSPTDAAITIGYNYSNFYINYKKITHTTPSKTKSGHFKIY
ncbi:MAG: AraC family transcriptional regulator [Clostridia bacterium]|nr:AraC family transcriptional regulator [Clostridia bacterium]